MKWLGYLSLLLCGLELSSSVHAQGCPPGMRPYRFAPDQPWGCAPDPNYGGNQQQQQTPRPVWADRWGALATDTGRGVLGTAVDMPSKEKAASTAMADCYAKGGGNCVLDMTYPNQCVAMVLGSKNYIMNGAATEEEAVKKSMPGCERKSTNCRVYYSACSLPVRIQ